jgi:hypothetical protein
MDFLQRQAFFLVCGAVTIGGIALGAVGYSRMGGVMSQMRDAEKLFKDLQSAQSGPVNQAHIDAELGRIRAIQRDRDEVLGKVAKFMPYEQLVEGFFPTMTKEKEDQFRRRYVEKLQALLESLQYGTPATADDVVKMQNRMNREEFERTKESLTADPGASQPPPPPPSGPAFTPGMVLTEEGARRDAKARAQMNQAQSIRCYAIGLEDTPPPDAANTLQLEKTVPPTGRMDDRPPVEDLWRAQLEMWIQEDVVGAIAAINEEAAQAYRLANQNNQDRRPPWVGIMPVKDVISIRLSHYVFPGDSALRGDEARGSQAGVPLGVSAGSFAGSACNDWYEVLHSNVKLVMDQRDIPKFVAKLCENRVHTLLRVSYESVPPDGQMRDKIYGDEPVVKVVFDFETIMLGDKFRPIMPAFVLEDLLGMARPGEEVAGGEDGG